eukprot:scaffold6068_cov119-Isochrysis_galbana.AAC.4
MSGPPSRQSRPGRRRRSPYRLRIASAGPDGARSWSTGPPRVWWAKYSARAATTNQKPCQPCSSELQPPDWLKHPPARAPTVTFSPL